MRLVKAVLVQKKTGDGLVEMENHVKLGKIYTVDLDTRGYYTGYHLDKKVFWKREIIFDEFEKWLPTEILEIEEVKKSDDSKEENNSLSVPT